MEVLRKRLEDAGVRELVEFGPGSEIERLLEYGRCQVCLAVRNISLTIRLNEDDSLYACTNLVCLCADTQ